MSRKSDDELRRRIDEMQAEGDVDRPVGKLPFARYDANDNPIDLWAVSESPHLSVNVKTGQDAAHSLIRYVFFNSALTMFPRVVKAIVDSGRLGGPIENAFFLTIAQHWEESGPGCE